MSNANQPENGQSFIPASQRPDGTWRKARRVKEGYVPQEEVPLYESKGKKFMSKVAEPSSPVKVDGYTTHKTIPGLYIKEKPAKKDKKKPTHSEQVTNGMQKLSVSSEVVDTDPAKKLKNLKKRLREVEALEDKIKSGQVAKPEPDQLAKVARKSDLILQIHQLEKSLTIS